jgi:ectoine hydroxylase-related dioxygenase (phytanoyl-CoA dioxygenase family)
MSFEPILNDGQVRQFHQDGFIVLRDFYILETEIEPILFGIHQIILLLIEKYRLPISPPCFTPSTFDAGYQELLKANRKYASEAYDAAKMLPAFVRLSASLKHDQVMAQLRGTDAPGFATGGSGIRIDNPGEEKFKANWHQDYPTQLRSVDGLVFWSPLVTVTPELGPVTLAVGSHKDGPVAVNRNDPRNPEKSGAYALTLHDEEARIRRYPHVMPLTNPGDLIVFDYLLLHASGTNSAARSRWSMQMRYFNFRHQSAIDLGWKAPAADVTDLQTLQPALITK